MAPGRYKSTPRRSQFGQPAGYRRDLSRLTTTETEVVIGPIDRMLSYVRKMDIEVQDLQVKNKELETRLSEKNKTIFDLEQLVEQQEVSILELERKNNKYRNGLERMKDILQNNFAYEPTIDNTDVRTDTDDQNWSNWYENDQGEWTRIKQEPQ